MLIKLFLVLAIPLVVFGFTLNHRRCQNLTMKSSNFDLSKISARLAKGVVIGSLAFSIFQPTVDKVMASSYLTEPTADFLEEEKRTAAMRKQQLEVRKVWDSIVEEIKASETPEVTEAALKKLDKLLAKTETIPTGVKKLELVKICRAKKFDGKKIRPTWTKDVEIAYEAMIQQFNRQFNPKNPGDKSI